VKRYKRAHEKAEAEDIARSILNDVVTNMATDSINNLSKIMNDIVHSYILMINTTFCGHYFVQFPRLL